MEAGAGTLCIKTRGIGAAGLAVLLGLSHCTFTACTGLGFGIATEAKGWPLRLAAPVIGFGCAMLMHAMHNALPTIFGDGGLLMMLVISWGIDLLFFLLLALHVEEFQALAWL